MFLAVPVENKPTWASPPWATVLLIVLNVLVYFGWQVREEKAVANTAAYYAQTTLPALELPAFVKHLAQQAKHTDSKNAAHMAEAAEKMLQAKNYADLYEFMWSESQFRTELLAERVIKPGDADYAQWRDARNAFTPREPVAFTARWAQNYGKTDMGDVLQRPYTLLTSTFLHGSFDHLLGNMVFLFLFGFALERALGGTLYIALYLVSGVGASAVAALAYAGTGSYGLGASGAIAGLMGMYAVLYRLRRIQFFYYILFYFNYARLPALVMLPVWMGHELLQHWLAKGHVAYMAHFGGLACGALALWLVMALRPAIQAPDAQERPSAAPGLPGDAELHACIQRAQAHAAALQFEAACKDWRAAAKLRPTNIDVLQSWFDIARHWPAGDDFHTSARMVLQIRAKNDATRRLQQRVYQTYLQQAKPAIRLRPQHLVQVARALIPLQALDDAERLCRLLEKTAPEHPALPQLVSQLANAWAKSGQPAQALAWQTTLQRLAPKDPVTLWLSELAGR